MHKNLFFILSDSRISKHDITRAGNEFSFKRDAIRDAITEKL